MTTAAAVQETGREGAPDCRLLDEARGLAEVVDAPCLFVLLRQMRNRYRAVGLQAGRPEVVDEAHLGEDHRFDRKQFQK